MLVAQKVRALVKCAMCKRPRCVYANIKLNKNVHEEVNKIIASDEYACGGPFTDEESPLRHSVVVRRQLTCSSEIEAQYFSSKLGFPIVCCCCGGASSGKLVTDSEDMEKLKRMFSVVRPICEVCKSAGKKPFTRAPRFDQKKKTSTN